MRNAQLKASFPWLEDYVKVQRNANTTKSGPGRRHVQGNGIKTAEQKRAGSYGLGLRTWITNKQAAARA